MTILRKTTPILRSFDEAKAREFYLDFLGFQVVFEHRFEPGLPLYMGVARGAWRLRASLVGAPRRRHARCFDAH